MREFERIDQQHNSPYPIRRITIEDFSYYHPVRAPLMEVNLTLQCGRVTCLIGGYKSGKSTIVNLLERRYPYLKGTICIDGQDLKELDKKQWQSQIAVIPKHPNYSYKTVVDNIAAKKCSAKEEANVIAFCQIYGFHHYITQLKKGYKTLIGNDPSALTGAQSQLIALARALYPCPDVLILNESTTAMDFKMEEYVLDKLYRIKQHIIILLITDRPKIADRSDYVYLFDDGRISEEGDPESIAEILQRLI